MISLPKTGGRVELVRLDRSTRFDLPLYCPTLEIERIAINSDPTRFPGTTKEPNRSGGTRTWFHFSETTSGTPE